MSEHLEWKIGLFGAKVQIQLGHFGPPILQSQTDHIGIVVYFHIPISAPALYQEEFSATHLVTIPDEGDHSIIKMLQ